jgi:hypothetical protein
VHSRTSVGYGWAARQRLKGPRHRPGL